MQFRLNLIICWLILGVVAAVLQLWLPLMGVVIVAALLGPRVNDDREMWTVWKRADEQLADQARQRVLFERYVDTRGGLQCDPTPVPIRGTLARRDLASRRGSTR